VKQAAALILFSLLTACGRDSIHLVEEIRVHVDFEKKWLTAEFYLLGDLGDFESRALQSDGLGAIRLVDHGEKDRFTIEMSLSEAERQRPRASLPYLELPNGDTPPKAFDHFDLQALPIAQNDGLLQLLFSRGADVVFGMEWRESFFSRLERGYFAEQKFKDRGGTKQTSLYLMGPSATNDTGALVILSDFGLSPFDEERESTEETWILIPEKPIDRSAWKWFLPSWRHALREKFESLLSF
jgi:hypothetical protein